MKKRSLRYRRFALMLTAILLLTSFPVRAAAVPYDRSGGWRFTAAPEKDAYAPGEEIRIVAMLENTSFGAASDVELFMHFSAGEDYLVSGDIWDYQDTLPGGVVLNRTFNLFENADARALGEKLGGPIARIVRFFCLLLSNLAPLLRRTENNADRFLRAFRSGTAAVLQPRRTEKVGECRATSGEKEIVCTFYVTYRRARALLPAGIAEAGSCETPSELDAVITPRKDSVSGLLFGAGLSGDAFSGGFFYVNAADQRTGIARVENDGTVRILSSKYAAIEPDAPYRMRLQYDGERLKAWLYDEPLDPDPWPVFDLPLALEGTSLGVCGNAAQIRTAAMTQTAEGATYANPLYPNSADPFILYDNGTYYLYATNNGAGYNAAVSTDLVHWRDIGQVAYKDDLTGDFDFWAPEVYRYNSRYYLFYTAEGHLAVAAADSPAGPFLRVSDGWLLEREAIDGHVFFDNDGRIWLYAVHFGGGNHLWVYELKGDLTSVKPDSGVQLSFPEGWEGRINEGPAVLKHNGVYYLTYSGDDYQSVNYAVAYMTSNRPTGPFTRFEGNPLLQPDTFIHGTGHHCFIASPDGSELFIAYHCHNTLTEVHPRALCIDRVKFVPRADGPDRLTAYGPTVTPQPLPSGADR